MRLIAGWDDFDHTAIGTLHKKGVVVHDALMEELEAIIIDKFGATLKAPDTRSPPRSATDTAPPSSSYAQNKKPWDL